MTTADLVIIAVCGAMGFGVVRNILGPSRRLDETADPPASERED